jgi:hypothetical protein
MFKGNDFLCDGRSYLVLRPADPVGDRAPFKRLSERSWADCCANPPDMREHAGSASPSLPPPRQRQAPYQKQEPQQPGEHRQHADAADHAGFANSQADPVVAPEGIA